MALPQRGSVSVSPFARLFQQPLFSRLHSQSAVLTHEVGDFVVLEHIAQELVWGHTVSLHGVQSAAFDPDGIAVLPVDADIGDVVRRNDALGIVVDDDDHK